MRWLKSLRYSGIGLFVMGVISFLQGCSVKEASGAALLVVLMGLASCQPNFETMYIVNFDNGNLVKANIDGTGVINFGNLNRLNRPLDIVIHASQLYITDFGNSRIMVTKLDGTDPTFLKLNDLINRPRGIAIDALEQKMYVAGGNAGSSYLVVADLDGSNAFSFGDFGGLLQVGQRIAFAGNKIYVSSGATESIIMVNKNGSAPKELKLNGLLNRPRGIAIDQRNGKMYVVNELVDGVIVADTNGLNAVNIGNPGGFLNSPFDIALDLRKGKMYIVSENNSRVVVANLDGSGAVNLGNLGGFLSGPRGIALAP
jgi:DNA-binding beta-propeller fold protein YncE